EITETNSYESDPYKSLGKFDFVMANPPFNVKSVKESTVKNDERFYKYGLPKNKGKNTDDSITDANYLWISLFATSLNKKGRAGFVMPNSASDAGNSEYEIRKKIVDSGIVDCMLSMPTNMFFTVTLPATLWFFDKQKVETNRKDKILFLDARNTYHQIDRAHREWKEEHIQNLTAIVRLYRGENERYVELVKHYATNATEAVQQVPALFAGFQQKLTTALANLKQYVEDSKAKRKDEEQAKLDKSGLEKKLTAFALDNVSIPKLDWKKEIPATNKTQLTFSEKLNEYVTELKQTEAQLQTNKDSLSELWIEADKLLKLKNDKTWPELELNNVAKALDELEENWKAAIEQVTYWYTNIHWLQSRFPEGKYSDVTGLCKVASKKEYAEEQDYSLNAGRYVGVELESLAISQEEFEERILSYNEKLNELNNQSSVLEDAISSNLNLLLK
ncbi:MAG: N-6 DNA methylase, partial [Cytophagales bacterium]|nr:N-6 DNA methylase [Cytophagales bacterium]